MSTKLNLRLERSSQRDETPVFTTPSGGGVMLSPALGEDYWLYRVCITEGQAVVGFPKSGVIGVGFAVEEDWNTNLPSSCTTDEIVDHIFHNAGDESITRDDVFKAVHLIQAAVIEDQGVGR